MRGLSGPLLSLDTLRTAGMDACVAADPRIPTQLRTLIESASARLGPASGTRQVVDVLVEPLLRLLGFDVDVCDDSAAAIAMKLLVRGRPAAALLVTPWGQNQEAMWGAAVRHAGSLGVRWAFVANGPVLRLLDAERTYSRRAFDCALDRAAADDEALAAMATVLRAEKFAAGLADIVDASDRHRIDVGASLQVGVEHALVRLVSGLGATRRRRPPAVDAALADALTVVYRILFLLFAEARGLVPRWHPLYRDSYTIEALRPRIEREPRPPGLWASLQAISRLAHRGCRAGTLRVTPFNGRLFAPASAPLADSAVVDDRLVRDALLSLTTRAGREKRERISYADLGVEQLGAVYERVLDYQPRVEANRDVTLTPTGRRKATGTFYTPRGITEYLVRRTLAPLIRDRSPQEILAIRVLDPAMGSGAFLVAACAYLAHAYEQALIRAAVVAAADVSPHDRAGFRRTIAQRCLFGVDLNATAVQLSRLSLWLSTLAADRPLTFLDHHLRTGNSLVGASIDDVLRQPPSPRGGSRPRLAALPLFALDDLSQRVSRAVRPRLTMATEPDDSVDVVRRKERDVAALDGSTGPLAAWRSLADLWCALWFWPRDRPAPDRRAWAALADAAAGRPSDLPSRVQADWLATARAVAGRERFFHWSMEFPEVFFDEDGAPLRQPGFDAVIGNPPWDALRGDAGSTDDRAEAKTSAHALTAFARSSGCFALQGDGHGNLYQLFAERMLQLVRPGGRIGMLAPAGLASDSGSSPLRTALLERCGIDALLSFENREAVFPIHRSLRFVVLTATTEAARPEVPCRLGLRSPSWLDRVPDEGAVPDAVVLPVSLIRRISGPDLAIPALETAADRDLAAHLFSAAPALGDPHGWAVRFGRELNATDDRGCFGSAGAPVLEGKLIEPFVVRVDRARARISERVADQLLGDRWRHSRLAYREVASSTNRLTLIAAIVPAGAVTTHTIFCAKERLEEDDQQFLCGVFNSYVANYLVRLRVGTHVTAGIMRRLPVPTPERSSDAFRAIVQLARRIQRSPLDVDATAALQAAVARLYDLDERAFASVLGTFPLVAAREKTAALAAFRAAKNGI